MILVVFFACGIILFRDYGASSDEINQIEAGHITWAAICENFGKPVPDSFANLPSLQEYYNRYYGQAATFPTVIIEAVKGFSMDISSVLHLRHLWNFLMYFMGLICLGILTELRFQESKVTFFLLLIHILTPRLFGDAFYNDRDVLLISLLWISLLCFEWFRRKPGIFNAFLCAFFFALSINTRLFGLVLVLLPLFHAVKADAKRKWLTGFLLAMTFLLWYAITPVFWGNLINEITAAFRTFATGKQRTQETGGTAEILFFGKLIRENDLPFYYLPLWIFISTPLIPQLLTGLGIVNSLKKRTDRTDCFMMALLCLGIAAVMIIRPVLYNGWRHMYFFYVPIFWFAGTGLNYVLNSSKKWRQLLSIALIFISCGWSLMQIRTLHPYEYLYLNPIFSGRIGDFDRDYWRLSTKESLLWIISQTDEKVSIGEINENLDNSLIGLFPEKREKISVRLYNALHRYPPDYLVFNYSGSIGNEKTFPLYEPVHAVQREGTKLSEIYKRTARIEPSVLRTIPETPEIIDNDLSTIWRSANTQSDEAALVIEFTEPTAIRGLSLLPGEDENEYARTPEVSVSEDGNNWTILPVTVSGLFDLSFPQTENTFLRIRNTRPADVHWSIREIYFY